MIKYQFHIVKKNKINKNKMIKSKNSTYYKFIIHALFKNLHEKN